jgi:hypothetical protein
VASASLELHYPLPERDRTSLPTITESDGPLGDTLRLTVGAGEIADLLESTDIVWRIVATVDSLPRRQVAARLLPIRPPGGRFVAREAHGELIIDPSNERRYDIYAALAEHLNIPRIVEAYIAFYPLFQDEYRLLGHPDGNFNDRLVTVIDDLLATPDVRRPVALVCRRVVCEFEDPDLEDLSAGQKVLLRMGDANAEVVKRRLRELRREIVLISQKR